MNLRKDHYHTTTESFAEERALGDHVIRHTHTDTLSGRELLDLALPSVL